MTDALQDSDGLTLPQRRQLVDQARANLRAHSVEQSPALYQLFERYATGMLTRRQLWAALDQLRADRTRQRTTPAPGSQ